MDITEVLQQLVAHSPGLNDVSRPAMADAVAEFGGLLEAAGIAAPAVAVPDGPAEE